jgi:predicted negative regulator of RcsB-dependent stress response
MSAFTRVADVVQKGAVLGLFSVFGWQVYQIGQQCTEYSQQRRLEKNNQHAEIMKKINEKVQEESQPYSVDKIPDRYDRDDDSYLQKTPKLNEKRFG